MPVAMAIPVSIPVPTSPSATGSPTPAPTIEPAPSPTAELVGPPVYLVEPERIGAVVDVVPMVRTSAGLRIKVTYPTAPGLYRLVVTLHTPSGMAYDAATQALLVPVIVRVSGPMAVAYGAPSSLAVTAGATAGVAVRVVNAGSERWDKVMPAAPITQIEDPGADGLFAPPARLVATWVSADGLAVPEPVTVFLGTTVAKPGGVSSVLVELTAPATPGSYLVLLDVLSPSRGPLSALGSAPAIIRVTVGEVPDPTPTPIPVPPLLLE